MKAVYGLYRDVESAGQAVARLRAAQLADGDITVLSSVPVDEQELGGPRQISLMPWIAAGGGLAGGLAGFALASTTQQLWPLPTGAMPIVTTWTDAIITYELTMLGAILATLVTFLVRAPLPSWRRGLYDPEVSEGWILVGVANPAAALVGSIQRALGPTGDERVRTVGFG